MILIIAMVIMTMAIMVFVPHRITLHITVIIGGGELELVHFIFIIITILINIIILIIQIMIMIDRLNQSHIELGQEMVILRVIQNDMFLDNRPGQR